MVNYLQLIEVWSSIEKEFTPTYGEDGKTPTTASKLEQTVNDNAVNAILNSVSENIAMIFKNTSIAKEMWDALIERYEGNTQIKKTKINGLETRFENFRVDDKESIEDIYTRLMVIQNEFSDLGEPLSNNKIVGKLLRAMMRRPKWEALISTLEALRGTNVIFTPDEVYNQLRNFEEKLKQAGDFQSKSKSIALPAHNVKHYNPSSSQSNRDNFV